MGFDKKYKKLPGGKKQKMCFPTNVSKHDDEHVPVEPDLQAELELWDQKSSRFRSFISPQMWQYGGLLGILLTLTRC